MFGSSLVSQGLAAPPIVTQCRASPRLGTGPACTLAPISKPKIVPRQPVATVGDNLQQRVSSAFTVTASQILSYVRLWRDDSKPGESSTISPPEPELLQESVVRVAEQATELDAAVKGARLPPPDISSYLRPAGLMETRYVRLLSSLCAQTYYLSKMTPRTLYRRHRLELVTSSLACEPYIVEVPRSAAQVFQEADAMATCTAEAEASHSLAAVISPGGGSGVGGREFESTMAALTKLVAEPVVLEIVKKPKVLSPTDLVAAKLSAAAAAAAAAAAPLASNLNSLGSSVGSFAQAAVPMAIVASQLQSAAAAGHSTATAAFTSVSVALDASLQREKARQAPRGKANPVEWFVADDAETHTRYFIIQGSDNFDHWKTNLTFDPVEFEEGELGVSVHRGVYETAQVLYARFEPLLAEHMASSPFAKVAFAGHSLGGSLATLLMMMYLRRGVLPVVAISPVYTFGAPAIFCEGAFTCPPGAGSCSVSKPGSIPAGPGGVLQRLGLPSGAVRNVMMPKDIVPRAFACDYTLVAEILKRVGSSFREHNCLLSAGERVALYSAVGKQLLLQPDPSLTFVRGEGFHPMLPQEIGLFIIQEPTILTAAAEASRLHSAWAERPAGGLDAAPALVPSKGPPARNGRPSTGPPVSSVQEAIAAVMDNPHPLETLADSGAYGTEGSISRYHNPDFYTLALASVVRSKPWWRTVGGAVGAGNGAGAGPRTYFSPAADRANRVSSGGAAAAAVAAARERESSKAKPPGVVAPEMAAATAAALRLRSGKVAPQSSGAFNNTLPYVKRLNVPTLRRKVTPTSAAAAAAAVSQEQSAAVAPGSPRA